MVKEEFLLSISKRIEQLRQRLDMDWYSNQNLQESIDNLRMIITNSLDNRPEYRSDVYAYLKAIDQLEQDIYS